MPSINTTEVLVVIKNAIMWAYQSKQTKPKLVPNHFSNTQKIKAGGALKTYIQSPFTENTVAQGRGMTIPKSHSWVSSDHCNSQVSCFVLPFSPHHILMRLYQYFQWKKVSVFLVTKSPLNFCDKTGELGNASIS